MTAQLVTLVHKSPLGALGIPGVGVVARGVPFQVSAERAARLLEQSDLYAKTKKQAPASADNQSPEGEQQA